MLRQCKPQTLLYTISRICSTNVTMQKRLPVMWIQIDFMPTRCINKIKNRNMSFILLRCLNYTFIIPWLFVSYLVLSLKNDCCTIITLSRSGVWIMKCFLVFLAGFTQGLLRSTAPLSHLFGLTLLLPAAGLCLHPWPM